MGDTIDQKSADSSYGHLEAPTSSSFLSYLAHATAVEESQYVFLVVDNSYSTPTAADTPLSYHKKCTTELCAADMPCMMRPPEVNYIETCTMSTEVEFGSLLL